MQLVRDATARSGSQFMLRGRPGKWLDGERTAEVLPEGDLMVRTRELTVLDGSWVPAGRGAARLAEGGHSLGMQPGGIRRHLFGVGGRLFLLSGPRVISVAAMVQSNGLFLRVEKEARHV